ncbi:MAG TPA: sugar ABC transporter substrate-binding protein [Chloroflexota bacterium]|jgi:multiple sugar transport system substrate-binding protein|nr:sugar ABC transporter substrate-binding protein [Chloroflexota bacterium]
MRQLSRRNLLAWAGAAAAVVACGPNAGQPAPKPGPAQGAPGTPAPKPAAAATAPTAAPAAKPGEIKLTLYSGVGGANQKVYENYATEFMQANPGIQAETITVVGGQPMTDKVITLIAGGTPPDLFILYQELVPVNAAVERKLVYALDDYIKSDKYDIEAFLPQAVELNRWDGKLWAIPRDYGNQNVYYNIDLFKKANVPLPPADWEDKSWTFETYLDTARKLTVVEGGRTTQWGILVNPGWRPWASFVYSNGGTVVNRDQRGVATDFSIAEPAAVEGLQFLQDVMHKHKVSPTPDAFADMGMQGFFGTGKVGMVVDNPTSAAAYRRFQNIQWDVAPLPVGKAGKRGTGGGGIAWAMVGATKNPDPAWKFLKHITSEKAQLQEVAVGGTTPSRTKVVNSKEFQNPDTPPKNAKGFAQAQGYVVRDPVHVKWPQVFREVVTPNMDLLWTNKADATTVAKTIKEKGDAQFKS